MNYEGVGRFIYGAYRHGGDSADVVHWMAHDLGVAAPDPDDALAVSGLYAAFSAKYDCAEALQENHGRFIETLVNRRA